ncbi:MAG: PQQ-dependent sugar dehydrogenase [Silicimonas sp.]|nr:PQQ-dependent sugar dehydrogenase [Silicimonas sp.]
MIRPLMIALLALAVPAVAEVAQGPKNVPEFAPAFDNQTRAPEIGVPVALAVTPIATGLEHPWGIAVLPGGGYLVTERPGRLNLVGTDGEVTRIGGLPAIAVRGQGGLLDVAVAEDFETTGHVFLTYARPERAGRSATVAVRATLGENGTLTDLIELFAQTPPASGGRHFGSRIVLDGEMAYVTIGDRGTGENAQDLRATIGKVVRVTTDGGIPADNPLSGQPDARPEIYSYGHRNPQGAALHPDTGDLWTLEHGPAGGDELNRIEPGANYGWPVISFGENYNGRPIGAAQTAADGMEQPRYYWDPVIAPGDFTFYEGELFDGWQGDVVAASLNPGGLVRLTLDGDRVTGEARYLPDMGRIRDVAVDRDGSLLIVTDDPEGGLYRVTPG